MKLETGHPICSLCKLELTGFAFESGPGARLCAGCRGLIQTALRRTEPQTVVATAGVQLSGVATPYLASALPSDKSNASTIAHSETMSPGFFEDFAAFSDTSEQSQPIESNLGYESFEMHFDEEPPAALASEAASVEEPEFESTQHYDQTPVADAPSSEPIHSELSDPHFSLSENGNASASTDNGNATDQSYAAGMAEQAIPADNVSDEIHDTQPLTEAAPTDPWQDPLPAWDYSRSEWPVLMGPPRERSLAKFKVPAAVALVLVFAAGFYYLIYPQLSRERPRAANSFSSDSQPEPRDAAQKPSEPAQPVQSQEPSTPSDDAAAVAQAQPEQKLVRDSGVANETVASESGASGAVNAQGRFALQAASFPTQAGADELAQKLRSAGVPSYVVSADLARRGRWFRVRVGRFNSAEDAQRFAGEAQQRAKAAGISLPLVVSQYDQP
jgi:cell division protein FtsN